MKKKKAIVAKVLEAVNSDQNVLIVGRGFWYLYFINSLEKQLLDLGAYKSTMELWRFERSWVAAHDLKNKYRPGLKPDLIICIEDQRFETLVDLYNTVLPIMERWHETNLIVEYEHD